VRGAASHAMLQLPFRSRSPLLDLASGLHPAFPISLLPTTLEHPGSLSQSENDDHLEERGALTAARGVPISIPRTWRVQHPSPPPKTTTTPGETSDMDHRSDVRVSRYCCRRRARKRCQRSDLDFLPDMGEMNCELRSGDLPGCSPITARRPADAAVRKKHTEQSAKLNGATVNVYLRTWVHAPPTQPAIRIRITVAALLATDGVSDQGQHSELSRTAVTVAHLLQISERRDRWGKKRKGNADAIALSYAYRHRDFRITSS